MQFELYEFFTRMRLDIGTETDEVCRVVHPITVGRF